MSYFIRSTGHKRKCFWLEAIYIKTSINLMGTWYYFINKSILADQQNILINKL
jgi:hypothetical protein